MLFLQHLEEGVEIRISFIGAGCREGQPGTFCALHGTLYKLFSNFIRYRPCFPFFSSASAHPLGIRVVVCLFFVCTHMRTVVVVNTFSSTLSAVCEISVMQHEGYNCRMATRC